MHHACIVLRAAYFATRRQTHTGTGSSTDTLALHFQPEFRPCLLPQPASLVFLHLRRTPSRPLRLKQGQESACIFCSAQGPKAPRTSQEAHPPCNVVALMHRTKPHFFLGTRRRPVPCGRRR